MNISIVTPLRDEINNLPILIRSIENQSYRIRNWIVLENGSKDGSKEFLEQIDSIKNVDNFVVLNLTLSNNEYQLGFKYSSIVKMGFDYIIENFPKSEFDFIGILDADNFPESSYYEKLIATFKSDSNLGILSGLVYSPDGNLHPNSKEEARGSCRLWKRECFEDAGYIVSMSADSVSALKARLKGWKTTTAKGAKVEARLVGSKVKDYEYYGRSVYYRGYSFFYMLARFIKHLAKFDFSFALGFFKGYFYSFVSRKDKINDPEILYHNSRRLITKTLNMFKYGNIK